MSEKLENSKNNDKKYDFSDIEDDLLIKYKPEYLGYGGEHVVFEIPEHPNVVVKVSFESIAECLNWQRGLKGTAKDFANNPDVQRELNYRIDMANVVYREILKYFPREHVPLQRYVTFTVSITPKLIEELARDYYKREVVVADDDFPAAVHVVAMVQEKSTEAKSDDVESLFECGYVVATEENQEQIDKLLFPVITEQKSQEETSRQNTAQVDFVKRAIIYTKDTGRILDIAGTNNVILIQTPSGQSYKLIDAIYPAHWIETYNNFINFMKEAAKNDFCCDLGKIQQNSSVVINVVDYVYKINRVALENSIADALDPLDWIPNTDRPKAIELIKECIDVWKRKGQGSDI